MLMKTVPLSGIKTYQMNKLFSLFLFAFLLISNASSAQFMFGPQVGFNYATLMGTDLSLTPKPEWHAGLLFDLGFGKHFSLQPSLLYSKRGYKYDYSTSVTAVPNNDTITTYTTVNVDAALGYIDIPVLLNVYLGDHHGFMINAGPQLSILLNNQSTASTVTNTTSAGSTSSSPETETKFKFNPTDISLVGGV